MGRAEGPRAGQGEWRVSEGSAAGLRHGARAGVAWKCNLRRAVFDRPLRPSLALQPLAVMWLALEEQE